MGVQPILRYETWIEEWKPQFSWQQEKWWAALLCLGQPCPNIQKRKYLRANKLIDADRLELWGRNRKLEREENMMNWIKEVGKRYEQFGKTELCKTWILLFPPTLLQEITALQDVHGTSWCPNWTRSSPGARGRRQQPPSDTHHAAAPEQIIFSPY